MQSESKNDSLNFHKIKKKEKKIFNSTFHFDMYELLISKKRTQHFYLLQILKEFFFDTIFAEILTKTLELFFDFSLFFFQYDIYQMKDMIFVKTSLAADFRFRPFRARGGVVKICDFLSLHQKQTKFKQVGGAKKFVCFPSKFFWK